MENSYLNSCGLSDEDLHAALREMKAYVDITEEDLKKIYEIALRHAQERIAFQVPVQAVMSKNVVTIPRDADLHEAARILSENRISGAPVVNDQEQVVGVISEADILTLAGMKGEHTFKDIVRSIMGEPVPARRSGNKVEDVMSSPPITAKVGDDVGDVAKILDDRRIKRLPVVDDDGKLVGIIARADIVRAIGKKPREK
jgi:CBS domain-containing membrane protein